MSGSSFLQGTGNSDAFKISPTQGPSKELANSLISSCAVSAKTTGMVSGSMVTSIRVSRDGSTGDKKVSEKKTHKEKEKKSTRKVKIIEKSEEAMQIIAMKRHKIVLPEYDLRSELPMDTQSVKEEDFFPLDKDPQLCRIHKPLHDVNGMKV